MRTLAYNITFHSYWLHQDKEGQSIGVDNSPIAESGLPIFGGKAVKGLFREQLEVLHNCNALTTSYQIWNRLFGSETKEGKIKFNTARFKGAIPKDHQYLLYHTITSTAIEEETKQAKQHSLRTSKVVIPMELQGMITIDSLPEATTKEDLEHDLTMMAGLIKEVGKDRYKGLGSCVIKIKADK
jgi:hypothetical protein